MTMRIATSEDRDIAELVDRIPDENEVRDALAKRMRECDFLRRLLRISKRKSIEMQYRHQDQSACALVH